MVEMLLDCLEYLDGELYWNEKAPRHQDRYNKISCKDYQGYVVFGYQGKQHKAHRAIWEMFYGPIPEGLMIDHIDRNPSNNKISNLRLVTNSENQRNIKASGVRRKRNKWEARASVDGKRFHFGTFSCFGEAVNKVKETRL